VERDLAAEYRVETEARLSERSNHWACDDDMNGILTRIYEAIKEMKGDHQSIYFDSFGLVKALDFREPDFHDVTSLRIIPEFNLSDDDLALLVSQLPNLSSLELSGIELNEDSLTNILGASSNVHLSLVDCHGKLGNIPDGKVSRLHIDRFEGIQDGDLT